MTSNPTIPVGASHAEKYNTILKRVQHAEKYKAEFNNTRACSTLRKIKQKQECISYAEIYNKTPKSVPRTEI